MTDKLILDPCCGSKMFWFDKNNQGVLFADIRKEKHILCDNRVLNIEPDIVMDFRKMPFADNTFKLIVFDPPHLIRVGKKSWLALKYGKLMESYEVDLKSGFDECWRVLDTHGTLIFKWNERDIKISHLLKIFGRTPEFGHTTTNNGQTIWMTFFKHAQ